ncbi:hypothetical protein NITGR_1060034 [Nitrospina gracilis 3/211]|uniref:Uncharacterized protein n=1 Tax=Nitrospina gracilis (strain 3/211) TaxID=1266370 RepID=M1YV74_NITG3|nr:hypothetical protein NITGR_1060034 [Nitrospina gracilis 3/211]
MSQDLYYSDFLNYDKGKELKSGAVQEKRGFSLTGVCG